MPRGIRQPGSGRPRLSDAEKAARGITPAKDAWRERRAAENIRAREEAAARRAEEADSVPSPDADLDELEQHWWATLAAQVDEAGTYKTRDRSAFRLMVRAYADLEKARSADGEMRATLASIASASRAVLSMLTRFGIEPSARGDARSAAPLTDEVAGLSDPSYRLRVLR